MSKINILDSSIFNLISAGEVVERPMSVVKELVENSIDAGSNSIEVEVRSGGIEYIRVTDDGCGIEATEIKKAFMPHATSKIASVEDLNSILTLGFRGEALASIAAVAKVTLTTRTEGDELGRTVVYENGKLISEYECGCKKGTSIIVEGLFDKIPARQKFLRSAQSEEADITNLISRLILANPTIGIRYYYSNKKLISTGEGVESALIAVYGNEILNQIGEVSLSMPDITMRGYICKPAFSKHSRNFQTLIVNGRYVKNDDISYMIFLCYKDYLMTRRYPMYVMYIDVPADMVDVNVHPSKMEVKFVQPDRIKKLIKSVVDDKLKELALTYKTLLPSEEEPVIPVDAQEVASGTQGENSVGAFGDKFGSGAYGLRGSLSYGNLSNKGVLKESPGISTMPNFIKVFELSKNGEYNREYNRGEYAHGQGGQSEYHGENNYEHISNNGSKNVLSGGSEAIDFLGDEEFTMVGTLFSTYIIVEKQNECFLIDQHAAHERILYDRLVRQIDGGKLVTQGLLAPFEFELSFEEAKLLEDNKDIFTQCGFEIGKKSEGIYELSAVPAVVSDMNFSQFLPIFFDAIKLNSLTKATIIKDTLAQSACKAAVKGDRLLSMKEIDYLIKGMGTLDALLCPHGRPIVVRLTKYEVEKWFKRK